VKVFSFFVAIPAIFSLLAFPAFGQDGKAKEPSMTPAQELSYALGIDVGNSIKRSGAEVDFDVFVDAIGTVLKGGESKLTPERAAQVKQDFVQQKRNAMLAERKAAGERNLAAEQAFLAENKGKEGVVTTESGLQFQVIRQAEGAKPTGNDSVTVHYRGTLLDGTEFDSSHARGKPATFRVGGVIPGWQEALQLMPEGSVYKLFIPSKLAYGEAGSGQKIGPNSTLIFEVELLKVVAAEQEQTGDPAQAAPADTKEKPQPSKPAKE